VPILGLTVDNNQVLLVRNPTAHHFPIFNNAWLEVDTDYYHKQYANCGRLMVVPGTARYANELPMAKTYVRINLAEVKEHKIMSATEVDQFLQQEAVNSFDNEE
jgi:hypothetical protein